MKQINIIIDMESGNVIFNIIQGSDKNSIEKDDDSEYNLYP